MISISNVGSAGQAPHYFSADNYHTQDEGLEHPRWFGKGAEHLGLSGKTDRQVFFKALNGKVDGQELDKWVKNEEVGEKGREHRPGTGVMFSTSKSVSLMAEMYGKRDIRKAHGAAVKKTPNRIGTELARMRQIVDGKAEAVQAGSATVVMFRHNTNRDPDPQTHTHVVIMDVIRREDGRWHSPTGEEIYNTQRVIGAIYTSELADQSQVLGYDIRRIDEKGNLKTVGIARGQTEHFSQRRAEVEAVPKAKGVDIDDANAQQKEDATLKTRARKTGVDHGALIGGQKGRAKDIETDFDAIQAKVDAQWV